MKPTSFKSKLIEVISKNNTSYHDFTLECLYTYGVYGLRELSAKQLYDFCRIKRLI